MEQRKTLFPAFILPKFKQLTSKYVLTISFFFHDSLKFNSNGTLHGIAKKYYYYYYLNNNGMLATTIIIVIMIILIIAVIIYKIIITINDSKTFILSATGNYKSSRIQNLYG